MQIVSKTICMKCQILFSRQNKKNISKYRLLKFLPDMQSVKSNILYFEKVHFTTRAQLFKANDVVS